MLLVDMLCLTHKISDKLLLAGGRGSIAGTLAGVFVFATIDAMFNMLQIDAFLSQVLRGIVVVVAVGLYTFRNRSHTA